MPTEQTSPFAYHKPNDETIVIIENVREAYTNLWKKLLSLPPSRERAVAITELETSGMWAIKGLVLNEE